MKRIVIDKVPYPYNPITTNNNHQTQPNQLQTIVNPTNLPTIKITKNTRYNNQPRTKTKFLLNTERCNSPNSRGVGKLKHFSSLAQDERFKYENNFGCARSVRSEGRYKSVENDDGHGNQYASEDEGNLFWRNKLDYRISEQNLVICVKSVHSESDLYVNQCRNGLGIKRNSKDKLGSSKSVDVLEEKTGKDLKRLRYQLRPVISVGGQLDGNHEETGERVYGTNRKKRNKLLNKKNTHQHSSKQYKPEQNTQILQKSIASIKNLKLQFPHKIQPTQCQTCKQLKQSLKLLCSQLTTQLQKLKCMEIRISQQINQMKAKIGEMLIVQQFNIRQEKDTILSGFDKIKNYRQIQAMKNINIINEIKAKQEEQAGKIKADIIIEDIVSSLLQYKSQSVVSINNRQIQQKQLRICQQNIQKHQNFLPNFIPNSQIKFGKIIRTNNKNIMQNLHKTQASTCPSPHSQTNNLNSLQNHNPIPKHTNSTDTNNTNTNIENTQILQISVYTEQRFPYEDRVFLMNN